VNTGTGERSLADRVGYRAPAMVGLALVTLAYTSVLYHVTDVVGGTTVMVLVVLGSLALGVWLGRVLGPRTALGLTVGLSVAGTAVYFGSIPSSQLALLSVQRIVADTVALLTGLSVLRLTAAGVWALAVAPAPVFLSWYLATRESYTWAIVVAWLPLSLLVLTGDAGGITTLAGVVGSVLAVGFGAMTVRGGNRSQVDTLVVVIAAMILLSSTVSVVPGAASGSPLLPDRGASTVESSLVDAEDRVDILGSIRLSPQVRFTVESNEEQYWQTAAYDRYTGSGWIRTGDAQSFPGRLPNPPGSSRDVSQTVTAEGSLSVTPAAWKPVDVRGSLREQALVTPQGGLRPGGSLAAGDSYAVESRVPLYTTEQLRRAGTDYPAAVEQYRQLPGSVSDRVRQRASEVTADAETPYDDAVAVEQYLEANKRYSLTVEQPDGEVSEAFLFEMDAGYCTYYATTMVTMLRSQGVPARFVVGYTPGQQVGEDRWVARGLDSHAWVQVYFPEVGWVDFDPTPAGPRQTAEQARLTEAREAGEPGVDTEASSDRPITTPGPPSLEPGTNGTTNVTPNLNGSTPVGNQTPPTSGDEFGAATLSPGGPESGEEGGMGLPDLPDRETMGFLAVLVVGLAAGARRTGASDRLVDAVDARFQGSRREPAADVERAFDRLEILLERRYRPRHPDETVRAYVDSISRRGIDDRVVRVADAYERARYGRGVTREEADAVVEAVDELAWESTPVVRRFM
jgi:transglutaminase-like putative cysteine protease